MTLKCPFLSLSLSLVPSSHGARLLLWSNVHRPAPPAPGSFPHRALYCSWSIQRYQTASLTPNMAAERHRQWCQMHPPPPTACSSTFFSSVTTAASLFLPHEGYSAPQAPPQQSAGGLQVDFESVFGAKASGSNCLSTEGD